MATNKNTQKKEETDSTEAILEVVLLKPTSKLFKNIHSEPAEEQQLERKQ